jgi:hypothetical protein
MCWFCGEYLIPRIVIVCLMTFVVIMCCIQCCPAIFDYFKRIKGCIKYCYYGWIYNNATVVPIPMAIATPYYNRPNSVAVDVPTVEVVVVWE